MILSHGCKIKKQEEKVLRWFWIRQEGGDGQVEAATNIAYTQFMAFNKDCLIKISFSKFGSLLNSALVSEISGYSDFMVLLIFRYKIRIT
jgi:hypothetical protein